jgi:hypothetical protein
MGQNFGHGSFPRNLKKTWRLLSCTSDKNVMNKKPTLVKGFFKSHPSKKTPRNAGMAANTAKFISFARKI